MPKVGDPIRIGKVELRNRIAVAPTLLNYSSSEGYATTRLVTYHDRLAQGGWGWITVGIHSVERWHSTSPFAGSIHEDTCISGLSEVVQAIHRWHVPCSLQIMAAGRQAAMYPHLWGTRLGYDPRGLVEGDLYDYGAFHYRAMSTEQCQLEQDKFAMAAQRAKRAGFDGVTFHGASSFLIQQFLSPTTNKRTDRYKDGLLWVTEMIRKVRAAVGSDFALIMRSSGHEYVPGGYELDWYAKEACPAMVEAGIDALDITAGSQEPAGVPYGYPPIYQPMGLLMHIPEAVKKKVNVPVIGVGKINDPRMVRRYIEEGKCDIVSVSRQALADPDFPKKVLSCQDDEIRKCMYCDYCFLCLLRDWPIKCSVNSEQGRPTESRIIKAEKRRKVVVIGGGVGGMEAARVADLQGHDVTLFEKGTQLGGMVSVVSRMPNIFLRSLNNSVEWLSRRLEKQGIKVEVGREITAQMVADMKPDVVIIATGSRAAVVDIPGVRRPNVFTMDDYLEEKTELGNRVVVLGGGYGAEISVSIARGGKQVTLIADGGPETIGVTPYDISGARYMMLQRFLAEAKVNVVTNAQVKELTDGGVEYVDQEDKLHTAEADSVILATGRVPNRELVYGLQGKVAELYEVGDCWRPDKIASAIHDGAHIARLI
jgi:2,4-dienoyl-CoA reductase-like NADH-dependent reductase (Old Yellow Enzyme family)/thioredoxin reductase